ncbi:hypothetical protein OF83DRAFT_1169367 [Amylostereum chailletii]|nr:hypothetical protein OF83DRAFT_1169367 [Amylostereum chailletii]
MNSTRLEKPAFTYPLGSIHNYRLAQAYYYTLKARHVFPEGDALHIPCSMDDILMAKVMYSKIGVLIPMDGFPEPVDAAMFHQMREAFNAREATVHTLQNTVAGHAVELARLAEQNAEMQSRHARILDEVKELRILSIDGKKALNASRGAGNAQQFEIVPFPDGTVPAEVPTLAAITSLAVLEAMAEPMLSAYLQRYHPQVPLQHNVNKRTMLAEAIGSRFGVASA